jgi:hypothetical protein
MYVDVNHFRHGIIFRGSHGVPYTSLVNRGKIR